MIFQGYLDKVENDRVRGWVYNQSQPDEPVKIDIYANGVKLLTMSADLYRPDLKNSGIGNGFHGFDQKIDSALLEKFIEVKVHGTNYVLFRSLDQPNHSESDLSDRILVRNEFSKQYIKGKGIEIGALHSPLAVPRGAKVKYVDRLSKKQLRDVYPELGGRKIVEVDIIDDGERLNKIEDETLDFAIALHFLEHTQDPIRTVENMLRVLRKGGIAFIAIPDKRFTFDIDRPVHGFEHLRRDYHDGPEWSRRRHYEEWIYHVDKLFGDQEISVLVDGLMEQEYSIHFHVWTANEMHEMFVRLKEEFHFPFDLVLMRPNKSEALVILRKI